MDGGAWQAAVHGIARVGHDLATKLPPYPYKYNWNTLLYIVNQLYFSK